MTLTCATCGGTSFQHVIDTSILPYHRRENVLNHRDDGLFVWDACKLNIISREERTIVLTANATVCEYLRNNDHLIPKNWDWHEIQFHGTVFMIPGIFGAKRFWVMSLFRRRDYWTVGWKSEVYYPDFATMPPALYSTEGEVR
jgi:hypothetical protein